jgi:hypothetical protein
VTLPDDVPIEKVAWYTGPQGSRAQNATGKIADANADTVADAFGLPGDGTAVKEHSMDIEAHLHGPAAGSAVPRREIAEDTTAYAVVLDPDGDILSDGQCPIPGHANGTVE